MLQAQLTFAAIDKRKKRKRISKVESLVRQLLKDDIGCRNDDRYLVLRFCQRRLCQTGTDAVTLTMDNIWKLPSFESIIRTRAKIQNKEHQYPPTRPEVRKRHRLSEQVWREWSQMNF